MYYCSRPKNIEDSREKINIQMAELAADLTADEFHEAFKSD